MRHGAYWNYVKGCRCAVCRAAWASYNQTRRVERARSIPASVAHGKPSTYVNYLCRCAPCKSAWSVLMRANRERRKQAVAS